jgi:hypothetical protein
MSQLTSIFDRLLSVRESERDRRTFVRESYFSADTPLAELLAELRAEGFIGQVTLDVSQGTVTGIRVRDELKIPNS